MESLVIANIKQRKTRTVVSILGVALGVILVSLMGGLANGMLRDRSDRETNVGAEILFRRSGEITTTIMNVPVQYVARLEQVDGVAQATAVGQYLKSNNSGIGFEMVEGINFESYDRINPLPIIEGRGLGASGYETIVDRRYAERSKVKAGQQVEFFGRKFTVVGIYGIERSARIKIPLATLQELTGTADHCSLIYIKVKDQYQAQPEVVAQRIRDELPDNQIILTKDIPALYSSGLPQLDKFLQVVIGLSVVISTLVILLAMYTTITERTREIGILKSLGASKGFIIAAIEKEALLISVLGVIVGYILAFLAAALMMRTTALTIDFRLKWFVYSAIIGLSAGLLGALYPALRAATQDAVKALSYE